VRSRPAVIAERVRGTGLSTQRLILLGIVAVVLSVIVSAVSAIVVARVVRP
jgi:hypothetical protein